MGKKISFPELKYNKADELLLFDDDKQYQLGVGGRNSPKSSNESMAVMDKTHDQTIQEVQESRKKEYSQAIRKFEQEKPSDKKVRSKSEDADLKVNETQKDPNISKQKQEYLKETRNEDSQHHQNVQEQYESILGQRQTYPQQLKFRKQNQPTTSTSDFLFGKPYVRFKPKMHHGLISQDRRVDLKFPMYVDSDIGLSNDVERHSFQSHGHHQGNKNQQVFSQVSDIVQDHEIEQEMDDDVQTDNGIMWNAKTTCLNDLSDMYNKLQSLGFTKCCHNKEILLRVKFNKQYTRAGRFKEYLESPSSSSSSSLDPTHQNLAIHIQEQLVKQRHKRLNSLTRHELRKHQRNQKDLRRQWQDSDSDLFQY